MTFPTVPMPDGVVGRIGEQIPAHVRDAEDAGVYAALSITERRKPLTAAELERARTEVAVSNKILAAYNPGLIVRIGGAR